MGHMSALTFAPIVSTSRIGAEVEGGTTAKCHCTTNVETYYTFGISDNVIVVVVAHTIFRFGAKIARHIRANNKWSELKNYGEMRHLSNVAPQ